MNWLTNEIILYSGLTAVVLSAAAGVICFFSAKIKTTKLRTQLEKEYGEENSLKKDKKAKYV